jgi:hypothetical protein
MVVHFPASETAPLHTPTAVHQSKKLENPFATIRGAIGPAAPEER